MEPDRTTVSLPLPTGELRASLVRARGGAAPEEGVLFVAEPRAGARAEELSAALVRAGFAVLEVELDPRAPDRTALRALEAAAATLAREARLDPRRIGAVGVEHGGTLALLLACTTSCVHALATFDAPVLYPELSADRPIQPLELLLNLGAPWLAAFDARGSRVPAEEVEALRAALEASGKHHEIVLAPPAAAPAPGTGASERHDRSRAGEAGPDLVGAALERTLSFLSEALSP